VASDAGTGMNTLNAYFPGYVFTKNVIVTPDLGNLYPSSDYFPGSLTQVGFTDLANKNYRLAAGSPYKNAASDGTDVGANFDALNAALGNGPAPTPTPIATSTPSTLPPPNPSPTPTPGGSAPTAAVVEPQSGDTVQGSAPIDVTASPDAVDCTIMVDGAPIASFSGNSASYRWDTTHVSEGKHTVQANASNAAGVTGTSAPVFVNVSNAYRDLEAPQVRITYPASGTSVARGKTVTIKADASDNVGLEKVDFYVNGTWVCSDTTAATSASYQCPWVVPGPASVTSYKLVVYAFDAAGNAATSPTVTVFKPKGR